LPLSESTKRYFNLEKRKEVEREEEEEAL